MNIPLDRVDTADEDTWAASKPGSNKAHVRDFARRIKHDGDVNPVVMVQVRGKDKLNVVDGHHRYEAYRKLGRPVKAYVGFTEDDSADADWAKTHLYQHHSGGDTLNKHAMVSKESVAYRPADDPARSCGTCVMYHEDGSSDLVRGQIGAGATCDEWEPCQGDAGKSTGKARGRKTGRACASSSCAPRTMRASGGTCRRSARRIVGPARRQGTRRRGAVGGCRPRGGGGARQPARRAASCRVDPPGRRARGVDVPVDLPEQFTPAADGETSDETAGWGWSRRRDVPDQGSPRG